MPLIASFFVAGPAKPAGSKNAFVPINKKTKQPYRRKKGGGILVNVVDDCKTSRSWKSVVKAAARQHVGADFEPETGPVIVCMQFVMYRAKNHYRTGRYGELRHPRSPQDHIIRPDVLKLARAAEDALTGVVWVDDAQIVREVLAKGYQVDRSDAEGVRITVETA